MILVSTSFVRVFLNFSNLAAIFLSEVARMRSASKAAFFAPLTATVATGMPPGIWTIERSESMPAMEFEERIGTPITGRLLSDAIMPGKCAAPPAPAMITFIPLFSAFLAYLNMRSGVRCAETTVSSKGTWNFSSTSAAALMMFRSESLPIIILIIEGCLVDVF